MSDVAQTLADLIHINSVNAFYAGGPGEAELGRYIEHFFARHGIETVRQPVFDATVHCESRFNVIARIPGSSEHRDKSPGRLILEAHMDTVSAESMDIAPFEPTVRDGLIYGRGACDTKGGLAAMMHALVQLNQGPDRPKCDVLLAAVVDEEYSFRGVAKLCEAYSADAAIVAEPTELRVVIASKGVLRWRMISTGRSAHSSKSHLGVNAINHMARVVLALERDHFALMERVHPLLGPASCNVGIINGGLQVNFVPGECAIEIDRRLLPDESPAAVLQHYQELLYRIGSTRKDFDVVMEPPMLVDEAWTVDPSSLIVAAAKDASSDLDLNTEPCGVPFGSDASKLGRAAIPCIIFGPGSIDQAHGAVEFVELDQVERAAEFYRQAVINFGNRFELNRV